jgi:glycosyltransferase involved in cell wall biosynthesis
MEGISAVVITRDEEHNIGRCLASLEVVADEMLVVDSGSTDATCALATKAGARVVHHPWAGYAAQKNHANSLACHPWILSIDADEALSPELARSIVEARQKGLLGAYRFNRLTNYCGTWVRHGGWYPDAKVRLFHRDAARWEGDHVHERLVLQPGTAVTHLRGDLLHYSITSLEDHRARIERYSALKAQELLEEGRRPGLLKRWLAPTFKFVQGYLLQGGFLDGKAGWHIARESARAKHLKYAKLQRMLQAPPQ